MELTSAGWQCPRNSSASRDFICSRSAAAALAACAAALFSAAFAPKPKIPSNRNRRCDPVAPTPTRIPTTPRWSPGKLLAPRTKDPAVMAAAAAAADDGGAGTAMGLVAVDVAAAAAAAGRSSRRLPPVYGWGA